MASLKEGDRVRIIARPATEDDIKSGLYYSHYAGLTGSIQKVYDKKEAAVEVEHDSLTKDIRKRQVAGRPVRRGTQQADRARERLQLTLRRPGLRF